MADVQDAPTLTPFDRLCVAAGQLSIRLGQEAETIPKSLWDDIERAEQGTEGDTPAQELLLMAAHVLTMPRFRNSIHAREAFCAAAKLYSEQEARSAATGTQERGASGR